MSPILFQDASGIGTYLPIEQSARLNLGWRSVISITIALSLQVTGQVDYLFPLVSYVSIVLPKKST
jgi:hypothetical protein